MNIKQDYTTYIFDLDGTLLDTLQDLTNSVNYAMEKYHMPLHSKEEVRQFVGNGIEKLIERSVPDDKANPHFSEAFEAFKAHYKIHCSDNTVAYEGIMPMLKALRDSNKKLGIVSNKADFAVKELTKIYFDKLIEISVGEKSDIKKKPAPDTVLAVMKELGSSNKECVYIGDSEVDILTAKNAGVDCISVLWGFRGKDFLTENGAKTFAEKPSDIF